MLRENMQLWYQTAEEKGEARGNTQGKAKTLLYMLSEKFGSVDDKTQDIIYSLDENSLFECVKRILQGAQSVQQVLGQV